MHLLCPRSPWINALRSYFANLVDTTDQFLSGPVDSRQQMVVTSKMDGMKRSELLGDFTMQTASNLWQQAGWPVYRRPLLELN